MLNQDIIVKSEILELEQSDKGTVERLIKAKNKCQPGWDERKKIDGFLRDYCR